MTGMAAAPVTRLDDVRGNMLDRIGRFLAEHGLSPDPAHYAFAYHIIAEPTGDLAQAVAKFTEDGVRLSRAAIERLGGTVAIDAAPSVDETAQVRGAELLARACDQVDDLSTIMQSMQAEAHGFGVHLAESAAAIRGVDAGTRAAIDEIARLTGAMLQRVRDAEVRLARANEEADALRTALDEARGNARSDPLTGLPNRRAFDEAFAAGTGARRFLAICDVDHFKLVNDRFGHSAGDRVLKAIARTLADECAGHLVARYGGEEFALLFSGVDEKRAMRILDGARAVISAKRFRLRESDAPVGVITISAGIVPVERDSDLATAYAVADTALYAAKANGRDRVEMAPNFGG